MRGIDFRAVTFTYPGAQDPALRNVDLAIEEGTFGLVVGPTGSGKSTFLRAIDGLVPHFSGGAFAGHVEVGGRDTRTHPPREMADIVAFVPQDPEAAFVVDVVEDELAYAMENLATDRTTMRRRVEEVVDLMGIDHLRDRSVRAISGGEKQRVAIAAALTAGARVLVLDEPTSQLDPQGSEDVLAALQRLVHDHGMTVVLAEHRIERVAGFADVVISCRAGSVSLGSPEEAFGANGLGPPVAQLGRALGWEGVPLTVRSARRHAAKSPPHLASPPPQEITIGPTRVEARSLRAGYGPRVVLDDLDFDVGAGEIVAVIGRNGAGKTTLLRCLSGLHGLSEGTVTIDGAPPEPGHNVALCPQAPEHILYRDSVAAEIAESAKGADLSDDVTTELGLTHLRGAHPRDLSAGQRMLVAVAAVAATGAPILLLDEPTRGLDADSKRKLVAYLRARCERGLATVIATHDVELVAEVATRVVMLARGASVAEGLPQDVLGDSHVFAPQVTRVLGRPWLTVNQVRAAVSEAAELARP